MSSPRDDQGSPWKIRGYTGGRAKKKDILGEECKCELRLSVKARVGEGWG